MKNFFKGKVGTAIIILATLILAGVAVFTAIRLYQLRNQAVAPNVPTSIPQAAETLPTANASCTTSFSFASSTGSPSPTPTETPTGTPTGTPTVTPTGTPAPTPNSCNGTCGSNGDCGSGLFCLLATGATSGFCRNPSCSSQTNCTCAGGTSTPAPTGTPKPPTLPNSGVDWPTYAGAGLGILVIVSSLLIAL